MSEQNSIQPQKNHRILVVEDDADLREALVDTLELAEYCVVSAANGEEGLQQLALHSDIAMVVSDVNMGAVSGHDLLRQVKEKYPQIPVLLITAYASINDSIEAIREGAVDYLVKPFEPKKLVQLVSRYAIGCPKNTDEPIAEAAASTQLLQLARRVAASESTVLICGESGTGKEVLAQYIHKNSPRADKPFIAINCAAIPENMLEAMLFGHEKGAYTGAHTSAPGKFEQANGGTLLLDEISEMDAGLQAKLLRVLQEKEVERLGGRKTIKLDVRVIATSNREMLKEVSAGRFREDLYFRLSVLPLAWQPLRERLEDILPLARKLLFKHAEKQHRNNIQLGETACQALLHYDWPGNVRELDNVMQRALILQQGQVIHAEDLGLPSVPTYHEGQPQVGMAAVKQSEVVGSQDDQPVELGADLRQREFEIIVNTLKEEGGSRKNTAERLGISPRTLRYKLAKMREQGFNLEAALSA